MGVGLPFPSLTRRGKEGVGERKGKAPLPFPLLVGVGKRGVLLLLGGGLLLLARPTGAGRPPPLLLYIRGQEGTQIGRAHV